MFSRTASIPAPINWRIAAAFPVAGPNVARIFVLENFAAISAPVPPADPLSPAAFRYDDDRWVFGYIEQAACRITFNLIHPIKAENNGIALLGRQVES